MTDNREENLNDGELSDDALENVSGGFDAKTLISAAKVITAKGTGNIKAQIDSSKCISCGACSFVCPVKAINEYNFTVSSNCTGCGACKNQCPVEAISF